MKIQLIRNATMKICYAGQTILTDPMLSRKDTFDPFAGVARNPTTELPCSLDDILEEVNAVIVSHVHSDHFDEKAGDNLPKSIPIFCQPGDETHISKFGFRSIIPIETSTDFKGITITRTGGQHGSGKILEMTGEVSGIVLQASGEPTIYWVGDSIWCSQVEQTIDTFNPDVIITHSGGARIPGYDIIIMDDEQTITTAKAAPNAIVVAVHLESLDHCSATRAGLRKSAERENISSSHLLIPEDGEIISF